VRLTCGFNKLMMMMRQTSLDVRCASSLNVV